MPLPTNKNPLLNQPIVSWEGPVDFESFQQRFAKLGDNGASLKRHILIFPGDETPSKPLFSETNLGHNLAQTAREFSAKGLASIALPIFHSNPPNLVTCEMAVKATEKLFYAVGLGCTLVLPVRDASEHYTQGEALQLGKDYLAGTQKYAIAPTLRDSLFKHGICHDTNLTFHFWNGDDAVRPAFGEEHLEDVYVWSLCFLKHLSAHWSALRSDADRHAFCQRIQNQELRNIPITADEVRTLFAVFQQGLADAVRLERGESIGLQDPSCVALMPPVGMRAKSTHSNSAPWAVSDALWKADLALLQLMQQAPSSFINEITAHKQEGRFEISIKGKPEKISYYPKTREAVIHRYLATEDSYRILLIFAFRKQMPWIDVSELSHEQLKAFQKVKAELKIEITLRDFTDRSVMAGPRFYNGLPPNPQAAICDDDESPELGRRIL